MSPCRLRQNRSGERNAGRERLQRLAVLRLNPDGTTDALFVTAGKAVVSFGNLYNETAYAVAVQPDGKIIVAGGAQPGSTGYDFAVARFNSDGSLDATFGNGDSVTTVNGNNNITAYIATMQTDGKIVVAGSGVSNSIYSFAVVCYLTDSTARRYPVFDSDGDGKSRSVGVSTVK